MNIASGDENVAASVVVGAAVWHARLRSVNLNSARDVSLVNFQPGIGGGGNTRQKTVLLQFQFQIVQSHAARSIANRHCMLKELATACERSAN